MSTDTAEIPSVVVIGRYKNSIYVNADEQEYAQCPVCGKADCPHAKTYPSLVHRNLIGIDDSNTWTRKYGQFKFSKRPKKMTQLERENKIVDAITKDEGTIPHMYLDTRGILTFGKGININAYTDEELVKIPFKINGKPATPSQILAEANRLKNIAADINKKYPGNTAEAQAKRKSAFNNKASSYKNAGGSLEVDEGYMRKMAFDHFKKDQSYLRKEFPEYDSYSLGVQIGLHDMVYNLGQGGFNKFTSFKDAIKRWDFSTAAKQSRRNGISDTRNKETANRFLKDAEIMKLIQKNLKQIPLKQ